MATAVMVVAVLVVQPAAPAAARTIESAQVDLATPALRSASRPLGSGVDSGVASDAVAVRLLGRFSANDAPDRVAAQLRVQAPEAVSTSVPDLIESATSTATTSTTSTTTTLVPTSTSSTPRRPVTTRRRPVPTTLAKKRVTARQPSSTTTTRPAPKTTTTTRPAPKRPVETKPPAPIGNAELRRKVSSAGLGTVEYLTPNMAYGTLIGGGQAVHVLMIHRTQNAGMSVSPVGRGNEPVGAWAQAAGAQAGVNANWYGPFDGPAVSKGSVYGGRDHEYTALFGFTKTGDLVTQHHRIVNESVNSRVVEAVSGHPTLIHRGQVTKDFGGDPTFTRRHPRTAIGANGSAEILIVVTVDGRRHDAAGMTGAETAQLMSRLGAHNAVMLDGGGSSAMWIQGRGIVNRPSDPGRRVGNQIAFYG